MNKKYLNILIIISGVLVLVLFMIVYALFFQKKQQAPTPQVPIPTRIPASPNQSENLYPDTDQKYIQNFKANIQTEQKFHEQQSKILKMRESLPYFGTNFTLSYDIDTNTFQLYLNRSDQQKGQEEFDAFLKDKEVNKDLITIKTGFR